MKEEDAKIYDVTVDFTRNVTGQHIITVVAGNEEHAKSKALAGKGEVISSVIQDDDNLGKLTNPHDVEYIQDMY